jgi:hypothetical protein
MKNSRSIRLLSVLGLIVQLGPYPAPAPAGAADLPADVRTISGGTDTLQVVDWVVGRFTTAGLHLPPTDVRVHESKTPCDGHLGLTRDTDDRVTLELCTAGQGRGVVDRLILVHELAHTWIAHNVDDKTQQDFMELHGLTDWWDATEDWQRQGVEYAAETIAWAVFDEGVRLIGEVDDDEERLRAGFQLLTGISLPVGPHDHSVVERAENLEKRLRTDGRYRPDRSGQAVPPGLTPEQLDSAWKQVMRDRGLPTGLGSWSEERGGTVAVTEITPVVGLVAALDEDGLISGITLTGRGEGLYDTYDTVLAWSVLFETLVPETVRETWAGSFDSQLYLSGSEIRGYIHLGAESVDGGIAVASAFPHRDGSGRLP